MRNVTYTCDRCKSTEPPGNMVQVEFVVKHLSFQGVGAPISTREAHWCRKCSVSHGLVESGYDAKIKRPATPPTASQLLEELLKGMVDDQLREVRASQVQVSSD